MRAHQIIWFVTLLTISGCEQIGKITKNPPETDPIGTEFERIGVRGIEFFDSKVTLHMPFRGIMSCGDRPCEFNSPAKTPSDTSLLVDLSKDSLVLYETKLREFSSEIHARMPERGRMIVGIGVNDASNGKDVLGIVLPILEQYSIRPETVEVKSIPRDSIRILTNQSWLLIGDSVVFRHIVDVQIQRFVRK